MKSRSIRPCLERFEARILLSHAPRVVGVPVTRSSGFQEITATLTTDHGVYQTGQTVDITLTLANQTNHRVDLTYGNESSPITIWRKGRIVWQEPSSAPSMSAVIVKVDLDPGTSMTFTGQWTATAPGVYSVHSQLDRRAVPRSFRVIEGPTGIVPPSQPPDQGNHGGSTTGPGNGSGRTPPVTQPIVIRPTPIPVDPRPILPPIVRPIHPVGSPVQPIHRRTAPIRALPPSRPGLLHVAVTRQPATPPGQTL